MGREDDMPSGQHPMRDKVDTFGDGSEIYLKLDQNWVIFRCVLLHQIQIFLLSSKKLDKIVPSPDYDVVINIVYHDSD